MGIHIAIAGNIGAGKSTLCDALTKPLAASVYHEHVSDNAFLERFYTDPSRWGFQSAMHFLHGAWTDQQTIRQSSGIGLQERSVYEQLEIFMLLREEHCVLGSDECQLIRRIAQSAVGHLGPPDLILYLNLTPSQCMERIAERGREYEAPDLLPLDQLELLHSYYERWIVQPEIAERIMVIRDVDFRNIDEAAVVAGSITQRLGL